MFRTAELGRRLARAEFKALARPLRNELLELQRELKTAGKSQVIVDFAGVDLAGKGETVDLLNAWLDPRYLKTRAYGPPSDEERERPRFWQFWRDLPPRGQIGLYLSGRYSEPLLGAVAGSLADDHFEREMRRIMQFEKALADDGAVLLKFWMHLSAAAQKKRLKAFEKDPLRAWRVTKTDWKNFKRYDRFIDVAERLIRITSTGRAPWHIVEGYDENYRALTVATLLRDALAAHLADGHADPSQPEPADSDAPDTVESVPVSIDPAGRSIFDTLDMTQRLPKADYRQKLARYQARLGILSREMFDRGISALMLVEGPDAAGKGGAIRRVIEPLSAKIYTVRAFAAPTDEERAQHYLWRFWRHLSRAGHLTIYDRSWYGRVLVERIEGFATPAEVRRAYGEINDFEEQLIGHGTVLSKFWIHISSDEQLARFEARARTPHKAWKLTGEDWRNRDRWNEYLHAAHDMVERTSTRDNPWHLVEGNDKPFARVRVLRTLCRQYEAALDRAGRSRG